MRSSLSEKLFKDNLTKTEELQLIAELSYELAKGRPDTLKKLLLGTEQTALYHGTYRGVGQHSVCVGCKTPRITEKRLCRCMYYFNRKDCQKNCTQCAFRARFQIVGEYQVVDYEVPAGCAGKGIGEIDLILRRGETLYAAEVKPYRRKTPERLLRMAAEILTYTLGYPPDKFQKALLFFEKNPDDGLPSPQQLEYDTAPAELLALLKKADIAVFHLKEAGANTYRICKL